MRRLLPATLFGQTLLALLLGIGLSLAAGAWIYASARQEAVRTVGALGIAERIINLARLVNEVPADWRTRIVDGSNDAGFKVAILNARPTSIATDAASRPATVIAEFIRETLRSREVVVAMTGVVHLGPGLAPGLGRGPGPHGPMMHGQRMQHEAMMGAGPLARAGMSWQGLEAAVALDDGRWLAISTAMPDTGPAISPRLLLALAVMAGMIAALTAWAVRRLTAPLALLATAATKLGRDVDAPPLSASGSHEVRSAAHAFNDMQGRLKRLIDNRTLMLASISHDLRTQLTLLRLRAETVETADNRDRMLATIGEMEAMLTATLTFARDEAASESRRRTDVGALVASIADDMADAGLAVTTGAIAEKAELDCKPAALRRAVTNLIDNAVKYGGEARVSLDASPAMLRIAIEDHGPGIPQDELAHVLQPFYRVEGSRSRDTGGIGLGLAIASAIAEAHGGRIALTNRAEGGLRAELVLPR